ncbi:MAG TPA: hypothetical protein PKA55_01985 [Rhodoblastus sp.]|nr:hypothetical protein [Rhodoblastus sp.]
MNANWRPPDPPPALLRGGVRKLERADLARVGAMFLAKFRGRAHARSERLESHLARFFLDHPHYDDATASLVYETPDGRIAGFVGVAPIRMRFDDKPCAGSVISAWMVDDPLRDSRAAVALARAHLGRRHGLTLSDTASRMSVGFQAYLHTEFAATHSLRWLKPLNFAASGLISAADAVGIAAPSAAIAAARVCEQAARRIARRDGASRIEGWRLDAAPADRFAQGLKELTARLRLAPEWSAADLAWLLDFARERETTRAVKLYEARDPAGALGGVCALSLDNRRRAEVLQIALRPRAEEAVLRLLMSEARSEGLVSVGGRIDPSVSRGLFAIPRVLYLHGSGMVVKTSSPDAFRAITSGEGLVGGLVGDAWTPLAHDRYG